MSAGESPILRFRATLALSLLAVALLTMALRSLGFEFVFLEDGVVFPPADAQYHLRRALYTFINFPGVLLYDFYINYPDGAPVPWPPLFDFAIGGVARWLADHPADLETFEWVAAWASPICALLTLIPIYLCGTLLQSRWTGVVATCFFAVLPVSVTYSRLGNADHHASVSLIGACLLLACLGLVSSENSSRSERGFALLLGVSRLAMLLTWHGSLLYLALADGLLLLCGIFSGRSRLLARQALTAALGAGILIPIVWISPEPLGGGFSSIALSWLHIIFLGAVAVLGALLVLLIRARPDGPLGQRLGVTALAGSFLLGLILSLPGLREGLMPGLGFMTLSDDVGMVTGEQSPLFATSARSPLRPAILSWGLFAYLIPFSPWAALWVIFSSSDRPRLRLGALLLLIWALVLGLLALGQRRYGNDFSVPASLLFALAAIFLTDRLTSRIRNRIGRNAMGTILILLLIAGTFWPVIGQIYWPRAQGSMAALAADASPRRDVESGVAATLGRFMRDVRRVTPETAAYVNDVGRPAYGVIAPANYGHAIQYGARRPTATDPFWWYIGRKNWDRSHAFLASRNEAQALGLARALRGRFVLTSPGADRRSVVAQLHDGDGQAREGRPALQHFRLIHESERGRPALGEIFTPQRSGEIAYKLFEIVEGARLRIETDPGAHAEISIALRTPPGRSLLHRLSARANEKGEIRLHLSYATGSPAAPVERMGESRSSRTRAVGLYRIRIGELEETLEVGEEAVLSGAEIRLSIRS